MSGSQLRGPAATRDDIIENVRRLRDPRRRIRDRATSAGERQQWDTSVRELATGPDSLETVVSDLAAFLVTHGREGESVSAKRGLKFIARPRIARARRKFHNWYAARRK